MLATRTIFTGSAILLTGWLALAQTNQPPRTALPAPKFALRGTDKKLVKLADYRGQGLLVAFVLTTASPCQEQLPALVDLQTRHGGEQFSVLGLLLDNPGTNELREFAATNQINFPLLFADYDTIQGFGGLTAVPTLVVVDPQHRIQQRYEGRTERAVLETDIQSMLKK